MEQTLFQDYSAKDRLSLLKDNADNVENVGYMKPFTTDEISTMQESLAQTVIKIDDLEEQKKAENDIAKQRIKPLQDDKKKLLTNIKTRREYVTEICYKMVDHDAGQVGFYNDEGILVEERAIRQDEKQMSIFKLKETDQKTGTNN